MMIFILQYSTPALKKRPDEKCRETELYTRRLQTYFDICTKYSDKKNSLLLKISRSERIPFTGMGCNCKIMIFNTLNVTGHFAQKI